MIRSTLLALMLVASTVSAFAAATSMNQFVIRTLEDVQELLEVEDFAGALAKLNSIRDRRLNPYETAHVLRFVGLVYYQTEKLAESHAAYEQALAQKRLPESMIASLLGSLGRLGLMREDYAYAEMRFSQLLAIEGMDTPANQFLLAVAYLRQEKFTDTRRVLVRAIEAERQQGRQPPENWLSMLSSTHFALEDYEAMRAVLRELVELYPRERYLLNLAAVHGQLGDRRRQIALVESLRDDGRLETQSRLKMLVNLFLAEGLAYKAARLLEAEIERGRIVADVRTLEQLSQAWYIANDFEKAIPALERAAAISDSGELYMRLAGLHMDVYEWQAAELAARKALERGALMREGSAWMLLGMAQVRLNRLSEAANNFHRAANFDESRGYADQWLAYVENERKKQASLSLRE